jgi:hypothetical protein
MVYGGAVLWGSKKQGSVATSTVKAEFMAANHAVKEQIWLKEFLEEIGVPIWTVTLHCDIEGCLATLKNLVNSKYTKHIAVSFHSAREVIAKGRVEVKYVDSA